VVGRVAAAQTGMLSGGGGAIAELADVDGSADSFARRLLGDAAPWLAGLVLVVAVAVAWPERWPLFGLGRGPTAGLTCPASVVVGGLRPSTLAFFRGPPLPQTPLTRFQITALIALACPLRND